MHPGRRLLLSDGTTEVPFVDDGAGAVVARWPLTVGTTLHVVARESPGGADLRRVAVTGPVRC